MRKLILNGGDRRVNHWRVAVYLAGIVVVRFHVRIVAWVVIIRIIVVRIVRIVVPGEEPIIQPTPEAIDKDEEAMMIKVCMPPVPVVVPIRLMAFGDVTYYAIECCLVGCCMRLRIARAAIRSRQSRRLKVPALDELVRASAQAGPE